MKPYKIKRDVGIALLMNFQERDRRLFHNGE